MGDITGITDINGNLVASYTYDPWGKVLDEELTAIGELNPFRYRSYYYDVETELYYLQSRYYDPEVGRFINSDDVSFIGATGSEISYNPFAYCENNPVNGSDPSGEWYLNWKRSVALGVIFLLIRLHYIKSDISSIRKNITRNRIDTALATAIVYSKFYISAEIIGYFCKVASAVAVLNTIISLISFAITGGSSSIIGAIISLTASYFVPGLAYSIKMIYRGLKKHTGTYVSIRWSGISITFAKW